ncbi:hypothetical protein [uncultured Gimesia sp.]|uniref:hypothetical protein n=1 Tax=uncultured Gimesia sp. TaxID=1678688 RepID=UPI00262178A1|nr:hypothetical protein [uncultured Gimesia sp.]
MTTNIKVIAMIASALVCLLLLFPPRTTGTTSLNSVSRGFLLGDIYRTNVPNGYQANEKGHNVMVYATIPCRIDMTRLVMELMVVLSVATMLAFFLNLRSSLEPKYGEGPE